MDILYFILGVHIAQQTSKKLPLHFSTGLKLTVLTDLLKTDDDDDDNKLKSHL